MGKARLYDKYGAFCLALAAALLMALVLFAGGGIGLSNNGDFGRVMSTNCLTWADTTGSFAWEDTFRMTFEGPVTPGVIKDLLLYHDGLSYYPSIHLVFVRAAHLGNLLLNALTGRDIHLWHVQVLGLIYLICYAALLFLLFRSFRLENRWADIAVKLLCIFVLCDEGYIAYFNSLYSEPVQIIALLAMAVFALRCLNGRGRLTANAVCYFLSCLVYGCGKFVNIPAAALCIVGMAAVLLLRSEGKKRLPVLVSGALCLGMLAAIYLALPGWMDYETNYNSVFYGILKDASPAEQARYLDDLGLPPEMIEYAQSNYYTDRAAPARDSEQFRAAFSQVSKLDLLFFYLKHPARFLHGLNVSMAHSGFIRPFYLSNLDNTHPRLTFAWRFGGWSWLRSQLPFNTWPVSLLILVAASVCLWRLIAEENDKKSLLQRAVLLLTLLGSIAYQFIIPIISNGEGDLAKHMFAFAQFIDLLLLFLLARLGTALCRDLRLRSPAAVLSIALAAAVCLGLAAPPAYRAARSLSKGMGGRVTFGSWEGNPITWEIADVSGGQVTLLAVKPVAQRPYSDGGADGYGSNLWSESALRGWLNGEFLDNAFSEEERALILPQEHRVLLSTADRDRAEDGFNDFFAFHIPAYSDRGAEDAVAEYATDAVRLPDVRLLAELSRKGLLDPSPCWMETPYYNNGSMVRCLFPDGYFYFRDGLEGYGVRPVIVLSALP